MATRNIPLTQSIPLGHETRSAIIDSLWPRNQLVQQSDRKSLDWSPYFDYYIDQCQHARSSLPNVIQTHQDIIKLSYFVRKNISRREIEDKIKNAFKRIYASREETSSENEGTDLEQEVDNTINLLIRLCCMINVRSSSTTLTPGRTELRWKNKTPRSFLSRYFRAKMNMRDVQVRFEKTFTARNIHLIAGITIQWTDSIADHLRMLDNKTVAIFHHASFLKHQAIPVFPPFFPSLYPNGLVEETLQTLALLFPQYDKELRLWLQSYYKSGQPKIDKQLLYCGHLRSEERQQNHFHFWHDRLVILKQVYDESSPAKLSQWWFDRRNTVQWYTFWVAIIVLFLTILFGLIQSIEGALQVYKAYHPST